MRVTTRGSSSTSTASRPTRKGTSSSAKLTTGSVTTSTRSKAWGRPRRSRPLGETIAEAGGNAERARETTKRYLNALAPEPCFDADRSLGKLGRFESHFRDSHQFSLNPDALITPVVLGLRDVKFIPLHRVLRITCAMSGFKLRSGVIVIPLSKPFANLIIRQFVDVFEMFEKPGIERK